MRERLLLAYVWESGDAGARAARLVLAPFGRLFGLIVSLRNRAYDRGWLRALDVALPTIGVGNLTVGGTGKTPVAAWLVGRLKERGARPALVTRGYGADEATVHRRLNPEIPVIADADRVRGIATARAQGATVAVLDDGFQHRRAHRDADIVLLSADRFGPVRPLPAGPWREPLTSLARATIVIVTRKSASPVRARELLQHALRFAPKAAGVLVHLAPDTLVSQEGGTARPVSVLSGQHVLAISAIGDSRSFEAQLRVTGARVESAAFPDHHPFTAEEARILAVRAARLAYVVCTLKDVVKLAPLWPREAPPLWYLSQRVAVEVGAEALDGLVADFASRAARDRSVAQETPGAPGPTTDSNGS